MGKDWRIVLSIIPTNHFVVPAGCQYQLRLSLTPLHRVDTLGVTSGENSDRTLLVSQIPNLKFVAFLVIQRDGQLSGDFFTPADDDVPVTSVGRGTVLELENRFVGLDVPQCDLTVFTGRCKDVGDLLVPGHRSDVRTLVRISSARLFYFRFGDVLADVENQYIC